MKYLATEEVSPAFEILLESVELEVTKLNELGSEAFKKRDYPTAKNLADQAEKFTGFRTKVLTLSSEWEKLKAAAPQPPPEPHSKSDRKFLGKLRKGMRTPETTFYQPLLEVLAEVGGGAEMSKVLDKLYPKIASLLKPVDEQHLPSGPKTGPRWRNTAQWARNTLKEHGHMKSDSPHGVWEITDAGRKWLEKAKLKGGSMAL